ncbi:MAG TPA: YfhO family protein, partial [Vicinamibacteria bacterium]|nr:YfhO family protein [Vicinamibacteria bacterium]
LLLAAAAAALLAAVWVAPPPGGLAPYLAFADERVASLAARSAALKLARSAVVALALALLLWRRAARPQAGRAATGALLLLGAADLVAVGRGVNPLAPRELVDHRPAVVDRLGGGETRLHAALEGPGCLTPGSHPSGWAPGWIAALGFQDALRPPSGARWGLRGSYDGEFTGLGSRWNAPFTAAAGSRLGTPDGLRLLQIGGVSHVLRVGTSPVPGLDLLETRPSPYVCPLQVFRVPDPLPGAYVVRGERGGADVETVLRLVLDPSFDPRREVVLSDARAAAPAASGPDEVRVVARRVDALELEARLGAPGVLVALESFDAGWRARVDGQEEPVLRANGLFRAVRLAGGRHRILMSYRPRAAALGAALSLLGLAVAGAGLGLRARGAWRARASRLPGRRPEGSIGAGGAS